MQPGISTSSSSSQPVLGAGQYFGRTLRQSTDGGLIVTLSDYPAGQRQPSHVHENPVIFVLVSGAHRDCLPAGEHLQAPLAMVFHADGQAHATEVGPRGMRGLNIEFPSAWLAELELDRAALSESRPLEGDGASVMGLGLLAASLRSGEHAHAELETLAIEALDRVRRLHVREPRATRARCVEVAQERIRADSRAPIGLREIARSAGVHPVYLARAFRRARGRSVSQYLREVRLADAARLILHERRSIAEAAALAGFADQAHLTRWFVRRLRIAPGRLRRRAGLG